MQRPYHEGSIGFDFSCEGFTFFLLIFSVSIYSFSVSDLGLWTCDDVQLFLMGKNGIFLIVSKESPTLSKEVSMICLKRLDKVTA